MANPSSSTAAVTNGTPSRVNLDPLHPRVGQHQDELGSLRWTIHQQKAPAFQQEGLKPLGQIGTLEQK
ncbi:MAG: hypothetical protein ACFCU9_09960 [Cyanophyceae cyanobacterium]